MFLKGYVLFVSVTVVLMFFILGLVLARKADKKDLLKVTQLYFRLISLPIHFLITRNSLPIHATNMKTYDLLQVGVCPLPDNNPDHNYLYQITVWTGLRRDAGTKSNVYFILSGLLEIILLILRVIILLRLRRA